MAANKYFKSFAEPFQKMREGRKIFPLLNVTQPIAESMLEIN